MSIIEIFLTKTNCTRYIRVRIIVVYDFGFQRHVVYVTFPCSNPVHAGNARSIRAGIVHSFSATGFGRSIIPRDLEAWELKTTGKQTFPPESFGQGWEIIISTMGRDTS